MIISHRHQFVFVKTNKTAGSSLEILFSEILGPEDIATKLSPEEESLRDHLPSRRLWQSARRRKGVRQHSSYEKALLAHPVCQDYFSFGFTRNPFTRLVSAFRWKTAPFIRRHIEHGREMPELYGSTSSPILNKFKKFVTGGRHMLNARGMDLLVGKTKEVHHVYRYEDMNDAVADISKRIGTPLDTLQLPRLKANTPRLPEHWTLWDEDLIVAVNEMFAWDFDTFGYPRSP
jgi:hypothetical protein